MGRTAGASRRRPVRSPGGVADGAAVPGAFAPPAPYAYCCLIRHCDGACDCTCLEVGSDWSDQASVGLPAAVLAEPVLSAGGSAPPRHLATSCAWQSSRASAELLLALDECETGGLGRLGAMNGFEVYGVVRRTVVPSKTLGGAAGSISAVAMSAAIEEEAPGGRLRARYVARPGPDAGLVVARAVIDVVVEEGLAARACPRGKYLLAGLREPQERHEHIGDVRGLRLLWCVELVEDRGTREPADAPGLALDRRVPAPLAPRSTSCAGRHGGGEVSCPRMGAPLDGRRGRRSTSPSRSSTRRWHTVTQAPRGGRRVQLGAPSGGTAESKVWPAPAADIR